jgi:SAM-dependent methyltransferase
MGGKLMEKEGLLDLACGLCGGATRPFHTRAGQRRYHLCDPCRFILLDPAFHPALAAQKERYLQHQNGPDDPGYVAMFRRFLEDCVTPNVRKGCRALDLGCGPSPVLASLLKEAGHPTEVFDPIFFPEASPGTFGLVTCTEVLEHLGDPVEALRPWVGRLEPGGVLAGMTLFHPDDPVKFGEWFYPRDVTHVSFYTPRTLEALAKALGLSLIFTDGVRNFVMKSPEKQGTFAELNRIST